MSAGEKPSRWNVWPIAVAGFLVLFATAVVSVAVFATTQTMDLVSADYYEQEIRHQAQMDRVRRGEASGASVTLDGGRAELVLRMDPGLMARGLRGRVRLYRPSSAALDRQVPLRLDGLGEQRVPVAGMQPGLWRVQASWWADGTEFYLSRDVVLRELGRGDPAEGG